ncbi:retrovirus-related pol polyprotein from transposon TNT 1-94 [Tanacetum coccineum]
MDSSKNKNSKPLDFSWISRIQKLEDENVSLDFKSIFDRDKVVQIVLWVVDSGCSKHMMGLGHNLFSVGQFCDGDLEVAFRSNTCYVQNLEGDDLLTGDMIHILIYFLHFSHFGFPHLFLSNVQSNFNKVMVMASTTRKKKGKLLTHLNCIPSDYSKLELLHMDLCGPMRVASVNGKKYILVIVDDFSRFTWSKVCKIQTDNGTEFKNATLKAHYKKLGIMQQFSIARTPQQNGVVERQILNTTINSRCTTYSTIKKNLLLFFFVVSYIFNNCDTHEAPPVITTSDEQTSPISLQESDEFNQEDSADFDGNTQFVPYDSLNHEEIKRKECYCSKWLWKNKCDAENIMVRNKSCLVSKGYKQEEGIDFEESFLLVECLEAVQMFIAFAAHMEYHYLSNGCQNTFLNGPLKEDFFKKILQNLNEKTILKLSLMGELLSSLGLQMNVGLRAHLLATERMDADLQDTPIDQTTYRRMIRGLMYLTASRPDIAFATFMRTMQGCKLIVKSTLGGVAIVRWKALIWMRTQLLDYGFKYNRIPMYCDSKSAIAISCNPVQLFKTKHIDIRYHFIKEHVERGTVEIYFVGTEYQLADLFTKALPKERFEYLVHRIGMRCMTPTQLESLTKKTDQSIESVLLDRKGLHLLWITSETIFHLPQANDNNHASLCHTSFSALADVMQDILQVLDYTSYGMGPTAVADNENVILFVNNIYVVLRRLLWKHLLFASSSCHFDPIPRFSKIIISLYDYLSSIIHKMKKQEQGWDADTSMDDHRRDEASPKALIRCIAELFGDRCSSELHLAAEEIEKLVEDPENVVDSSTPRHDDTSILGNKLEPRSDKESPEVEIVSDKGGGTCIKYTSMGRRVKGKNVEETRISPIPSPTRSPRNLSTLVSSDTEKLQELTGRYGYLFAHLKKRFMPQTSSDQLADNLHDVMMETLPSLVKEKVTEQVKKEVPVQVRDQVLERGVAGTDIIIDTKSINNVFFFVDASVRSYMSGHILHVHPTQVQSSSVLEQQYQLYLAMKADPLLQQQDIAIWQKTFEYEDMNLESQCLDKVNVEEPDSPTKQVATRYLEQISLSIDEASYKKMADEMLKKILFIRSSVIWERVHDFQLGIESYISLHQTSLKSYYNDVKYGYVQKELTNDEVEFLKLFEEEIEVRLNYRDQMRRWEMYVNGRPLGPRRERSE